MKKQYRIAGAAWLVCPKLLEIDKRHGIHPDNRPPCARNEVCIRPHEHELPVTNGGSHRAVTFIWQETSDHIDEHYNCEGRCHDKLRCECGEQLIYADLDDPR